MKTTLQKEDSKIRWFHYFVHHLHMSDCSSDITSQNNSFRENATYREHIARLTTAV